MSDTNNTNRATQLHEDTRNTNKTHRPNSNNGTSYDYCNRVNISFLTLHRMVLV